MHTLTVLRQRWRPRESLNRRTQQRWGGYWGHRSLDGPCPAIPTEPHSQEVGETRTSGLVSRMPGESRGFDPKVRAVLISRDEKRPKRDRCASGHRSSPVAPKAPASVESTSPFIRILSSLCCIHKLSIELRDFVGEPGRTDALHPMALWSHGAALSVQSEASRVAEAKGMPSPPELARGMPTCCRLRPLGSRS
jgi:hypothetical protein